MKVDLFRGLAVNLALSRCDSLKDGHRFLLHPVRERAAEDELFYFRKRASVRMLCGSSMRVFVMVLVRMAMFMGVVRMIMFVLVPMFMTVFMLMLVFMRM